MQGKITVLRYGVSYPTAVRPLARSALAKAFFLQLGGQSCRRSGSSRPPTPISRCRQPEDAVARTEPGECVVTLKSRGLASAAVT